MKRFAYKAKARDGEDQSGKIEARDLDAAVATLRDKGLVVVKIKPVTEVGGLAVISNFMGRVGLNDVVAFTRQLATMIASGLPLTEALSILEIQSKPAMSKIIGEVLREIQGGSTVAEALGKHPQAFSGVYVSLVNAGEQAGALDEILNRLADNLEKQKEFRAKTKGALIYPAIVTVGMLGVAVLMMVFVVPQLAEMYTDFDADLPLPTQILISMSDFTINYWYIVVAMAAAGFFAFHQWRATDRGAFAYDKFLLSLPVFGKLKSQIALAEMARTLGLLIGAGITLVEAMEIVDRVVDNLVYKKAVGQIIKNVKKGVPFSVSISREEVFPPLFPNMVSVGEETGKMDDVLMKVSAYFEAEAEQSIKNLTTALEPLIMIVLGIGVAFLVISIIMPIYNLTNQF